MRFDDAAKRRIRWLTRRGLLELDIMLERFMARDFNDLNNDELSLFVQLLDWPDQTLLAVINQKEESPDPVFVPLLDKIRQAQGAIQAT